MNKLKLFMQLFYQGYELSDSAHWKNKQVAINLITVFLTTAFQIATLFNYNIPVDPALLETISAGIFGSVGLFNIVLTYITTKKIGLKK